VFQIHKAKYLLFILLYTNKVIATDEEIHFSKITQQITILNESNGFTRKITCEGKFLNNLDKSISIVCNELEKVSNFKKLDFTSNHFVQKGITISENSIITESFYDGLKEYTINYMDTSRSFGLQYDATCNHLILLSTIPIVHYPNADTLIYEIKSPQNFYLKFNADTSLHFYTIDTINDVDNNKIYRVFSTPKNKITYKKGLSSMYEINRFHPPVIRVIAISAGDKNEWQYFNNWFNKLIKDHTKLKFQSIKALNININENDSQEEIIKKVFDNVNTNVKYVDVENGIEGFRPRDVNSILLNKYGDCKDMANALCQILNYYKVEANIAVIGSLDYPYQMDFPSLGSANHAICIAKTKENKTYYLDATDKTGSYYLPSQFTQGRLYYAFNEQGGERGIVPIVASIRNSSHSFINVYQDNLSLKGDGKNEYLNYSGATVKRIIRNSTETDARVGISKFLNQLNENLKYSNIKTDVSDSLVKVNSDVIITNAINKIDKRNFLLLNFLMFPHSYPKKIKDKFNLLTYQTNSSNFHYEINFKQNIKIISKLNEFHFQNDYLSFDLNFQIKDSKTLKIEYVYKIKKIELRNEEITIYEKLNDDITKLFNASIEYETIE
jgi:hypothetical protein